MVSRSSDVYITTKVKAKLFADKILSGLVIKVNTEKGVVYLMGIVSQKEAEIAVRQGVTQLILTDKNLSIKNLPIPMLLCVGAINTFLIEKKLRLKELKIHLTK